MKIQFESLLTAAYLAVGCVTFGHAAARADAYNERYVAECRERDATDDGCGPYLLTPASASGAGAAVFWPLYWSWVAFEEAGA